MLASQASALLGAPLLSGAARLLPLAAVGASRLLLSRGAAWSVERCAPAGLGPLLVWTACRDVGMQQCMQAAGCTQAASDARSTALPALQFRPTD